MFSRVATILTVSSFTRLAMASTFPRTTNECNNGTLQCCNSLAEYKDPFIETIAGLLGITLLPLPEIDGLIGLSCNPIIGGASCSQQAACCAGENYQSGLLVIGCTPINIDV